MPNFAHPESFAYLPDIRFLLLSMSAVLYYLVFIRRKSNTSAPLRTLLLMSAVARIEGVLTLTISTHVLRGLLLEVWISLGDVRNHFDGIREPIVSPLGIWLSKRQVIQVPSILLIAISSQVRYS